MVKNIPTIERSTKIRFGKHATDDQAENTIVFNASNVAIDASTTGGVYVTPMRTVDPTSPDITVLSYNTTTKEIVNSNTKSADLFQANLHFVSQRGNVTSNTLQFTHPTTAFITTGGVGIGSSILMDSSASNKVQVSGTVKTDTLHTDNIGIANTNPQNLFTLGADGQTVMNVPTNSKYALDTTGNINAQYYHGDGGLLSNLNLQIVTDKASITTNTLDLTHPTTSLKAYSNIVVDNYIFGNISGSNLITASDITSVNTSASTGLYGHILGSNTISATDISATNIQGTEVATDDLIALTSIYGEIKGSNVISASKVSGSIGLYGDILGSNVVESNKVSAGAGLYGEIKGSNAITASTITATSISGEMDTGDITTGILTVARGGTGIGDSYTIGDIPYASASGTLSTLGVSSATGGQFLRLNPGKTAPIWSDVPLTLDEVLESQTGVSNISDAVITLTKASGVALEVTDAEVALNGTGTVLNAPTGTIAASAFQGNGSSITHLDLGQGTNTGVIPIDRGGTGTNSLSLLTLPYVNTSGVLDDSKTTYNPTNHITSISSNVVISGNLTVQGNVTSQHTNDHYITDKIFSVAHGNTVDAKDMGQHMSRPTANVFAGFLGQTIGKEYTIAYTTSKSESDTVVPTMTTSDGYITANVWGNVLSGNVTTTGKVTAGTAIEIASGGTGRNSFAENDLLLGPASGTALSKLSAYTGPSSVSGPAAMSANSSGGNTASSSGPSAIRANAWKAFDGSDSTSFICREFDYASFSPYAYWGGTTLGGVDGEWVKIQLASAITPTSVFVKARPDGTDGAGRPQQWRILASNDDTNWTQLHSSTTVVDDTNGTTESFTNTTAYTYFAFIVTHINGNYGEWNLSRLLFNYTGSGPSEKFLKSSAAGISWDDTISGDGSGLEALNASNVSTGTLTTARGGTGLATVAENDLLLGPASGDVLTKLSAYAGPTTSSSPAAMNANIVGGVGAASSGNSSIDTWKAFDGSDSTSYQSTQWCYTGSGGYGGSNSLGGVNGEWIKIQLSSAIAPTSVFIKGPAPAGQDNLPASWRILGSNDDTNWTQLHSSTTNVTSSGITESFTNTTAYSYLAMVVTNVINAQGNHWRLSRLLFNYLSGPTEKFLKSSAAGVSWDAVSSTLQAITDGGATTTQTVAFNNTTTGLTSAGDIDIAATKQIDYAGDVLIKSSASGVASLKVTNAVKLDPAYAAPSNNVLSFNTSTGEIYDSGGQGGSTLDNIHEEGSNVAIGPSAASANLTVNTYGSNVLTVSGNVSADNITIGGLNLAASPFNLDDVAMASVGANVTSNVIQFTGPHSSYNSDNAFVTTNSIKIGSNVNVTGNVYSQNLQLTNTQITSSFTTGTGTLTINALNKSYGTAPLTSIDADVAILDIQNLPSGGQVVVPLLASGADRKVLKTITTGIDFIAFTSDVSIDQNGHALLTVSKIGASGAEKIYMNAISFTAA